MNCCINAESTLQRRTLWKQVDSYLEQSRLESIPEPETIKNAFEDFQYFVCEEVIALIYGAKQLFALQCDPEKLLLVK